MPLAFWIAVTLDLYRVANPDSVSPFFTTTRAEELERDFEATVFGLVVVFLAVLVVFGRELVLALGLVLMFVERVFVVLLMVVVVDFKRATSTGPEEDDEEIGVSEAGGVSLLANKVGSGSGSMSGVVVERRFHFSGLSAHAST